MNEMQQFKEDMAMNLYGRSLALAQAGNQCVKCGKADVTFRDEISEKEYGISGFCQCCQDDFFGGEEE
jgi:hypothetical protein